MNILEKGKQIFSKLFKNEEEPFPLIKGKINFVFIHINKTAGTSISKAVGIKNVQHFTVSQVIDTIGKEAWDTAFTFSVVRNPWDKVLSQYKYRVKIDKNGMSDRHIDFNQWVEKVYGPSVDSFYNDGWRTFSSQLEWLKNNDGKVDIKYIARYENLEEDFKRIAAALGISAKLPHLNKTKKTDYRLFYSETARKIVEDYFKEDIDYFHYTF